MSPVTVAPATTLTNRASGLENTPLGLRSQVYSGVNAVNGQASLGSQVKKDGEVATEVQSSGQSQVKTDASVKLEPPLSFAGDQASALGKRNPNIPSPSKVKKDYPVKASAGAGPEAENVSVAASSASSPLKNTPSKVPKASYARA